MLHHAIVTTWRGGSSPWPRSIRRGGSVNSRFDSPELQIKRADTRRLPSSLPPGTSAPLEKARALHVVQDAPAIPVLDDHIGEGLYVVMGMYVLISESYGFLAN